MTCEALESALDSGEIIAVEVDIDPESYKQGHVPGAQTWDWQTQLRDQETKDLLKPEAFAALMSATGISNDSKVVLYGDNNNWFACWAYWLLKLYGHKNVWILDGGARKWMSEGRSASLAEPEKPSPGTYVAEVVNTSNRATTENVFESFFNPMTHRLLDVRSAAEYKGSLGGPGPGMAPTCQVTGHIPNAINIPWNLNCNSDGTFKAREELLAIYASFDILPEMNVITYCAIGERSSLSWFVLKELLAYDVVTNYDRSMSQWSCMANAPIVQGEAA